MLGMVLFLPTLLTAQCFLGQSYPGGCFGHLSPRKLVIGTQITLVAMTSEAFMVIRYTAQFCILYSHLVDDIFLFGCNCTKSAVICDIRPKHPF
jgi:hypothetical protein